MVAGYREIAETKGNFGCWGPIRTEYTILEHTVPQRIDSWRCLSPLFAGTAEWGVAPSAVPSGLSAIHFAIANKGSDRQALDGLGTQFSALG
jgi:hypothetical protein